MNSRRITAALAATCSAAAIALALSGCHPFGQDWERFDLFSVIADGDEMRLVGIDVERQDTAALRNLDLGHHDQSVVGSSVAMSADGAYVVVATTDKLATVFHIDREAGRAVGLGTVRGAQFSTVVGNRLAVLSTGSTSSEVTWYDLPANDDPMGLPLESAVVPFVVSGAAPSSAGLMLVGDGPTGSTVATVTADGEVTSSHLPVRTATGIACTTSCVISAGRADGRGVLMAPTGEVLAPFGGEPGPMVSTTSLMAVSISVPDGLIAPVELIFRSFSSTAVRKTNSRVTVEGVQHPTALGLVGSMAVLLGDTEVAFAEPADTRATLVPLSGVNTTESITFAR